MSIDDLGLIKPKPFNTHDLDGNPRRYIISRLPMLKGRKYFTQFVTSAIPKMGDYSQNEELMRMMYCHVAALDENDNPILLNTAALIENHVPDFETSGRIEAAMWEYNTNFFQPGRLSNFLNGFAQMTIAKIIETLTPSSPPSSGADLPPSTNSEQSMT